MNSEQINQIMNHYNLNSGDFAEEIGTAPATISNIRNGKTKATLEIVEKIRQRFPEINLEWLIDGRGEMIKSAEIEKDNKPKVPHQLSIDDILDSGEDNKAEKSKREEPSTTNFVAKPVRTVAENRTASVVPTKQPIVKDIETVSESIVESSTKREIVKIIVYYNDKTFDEIDVTKCRI